MKIMGTILVVVLLAGALVGLLPSDAKADNELFGPFCFSSLPFADTFLFYFQRLGSAPRTFQFTGRNTFANRAVDGSATLVNFDTQILLGYQTSFGVGGNGVAGGGTISNFTGAGPGTCERYDAAGGGCGTGTNFNFALIGCGGLTSDSEEVKVGDLPGGQ